MSGADRSQPVVLVFGKDVGAVAADVARVRKEVLAPGGVSSGLEAFNHERFEGPYVKDIAQVLTACATVPVGAGQRLVELSAPEGLGKLARRDEGADAPDGKDIERWQTALLDYVASPSPSTVLLLSSTELKGNAKLVNAVKKSGAGLVLKHDLESRDDVAAQRLAAAAREQGTRIAPAAARRIVELVGTGTAETLAALGHARAYAGDAAISVEVVESVVDRSREDSIWALTDALGARDTAAALTLLARQFGEERGDAIYGLVPALASHLRKVYAAKAARGRAAQVLGGPAFVVQKIERQARHFDDAQLRHAVAGLARLDAQTKGAAPGARLVYEAPLLALQRWVMQVCGAMPGTATD